MSSYIKSFDDFVSNDNYGRDTITADMSMADIYRKAGLKMQKPAKIKKKHQEVIDNEIDGYLDGLFDGLPPEEARKKGKKAGERRTKLNTNREIYEYDEEVRVDDIGKTPVNKTRKNEKEFSFREYTEQPKVKKKCMLQKIWDSLFGNEDRKESDECVKLKF